jgi:glycosidase
MVATLLTETLQKAKDWAYGTGTPVRQTSTLQSSPYSTNTNPTKPFFAATLFNSIGSHTTTSFRHAVRSVFNITTIQQAAANTSNFFSSHVIPWLQHLTLPWIRYPNLQWLQLHPNQHQQDKHSSIASVQRLLKATLQQQQQLEGATNETILHGEDSLVSKRPSSAQLADAIVRALRDVALDEGLELHAALRFWSERWERPLLSWLEAGPEGTCYNG